MPTLKVKPNWQIYYCHWLYKFDIKIISMDREIPIANRVIHKKVQERSNDILLNKIVNMKFSNFTYFKGRTLVNSQKRNIQDQHRLQPIEDKFKRAKTVLNNVRIKQQNKQMYTRLINLRPTLSSKIFERDRQKNVEFLKRIGKYPYKTCLSSVDDCQQGNLNPLYRRHTLGDMQQNQNSVINLHVSNDSAEMTRNDGISLKIMEEQKKNHLILLWRKNIQLNKDWFSVKFMRFKNHYQIQMVTHSVPKYQYFLKLTEEVGMALLTQNDYNYDLICKNFLKSTHQYLCLSFQVQNPAKKKHFYRFEKRKSSTDNQIQIQVQPKMNNFNSSYRKTIFALENEQVELFQKQKAKQSNRNNKLQQQIIIQLSKR